MNVHFIAIGGAAMHNLAIALHKKGIHVTGSDDEIFEPSRSRLAKYNLLPKEDGWFPEKITKDIDAIILGMHARKDNPELLKALELNIKIYSYPDFIYEQTKDKIRAVVGGSHGKTTITSMIMHVLKSTGKKFDYLVGSQIEGFETMVGLDESSVCAVIEGDEYLASPLTPVPKFHLYRPQIAIISGIAWDHINVFPTYGSYVEQFEIFIRKIEPGGRLIYCVEDQELKSLVSRIDRNDIQFIPYGIPDHEVRKGVTFLKKDGKEYELKVFGDHNLMNLLGAQNVCAALGVDEPDFLSAIRSFTGASRRLELLYKNDQTIVYKDFAHSPSKLKATIQAVKKQFPNRPLTAVMELHTFSSLNKNFLREYKDCMNDADEAVVFYSPQTVAHKKLESISKSDIREGFDQNLEVIDQVDALESYLRSIPKENRNILLMSSGNWGGIDISGIFS